MHFYLMVLLKTSTTTTTEMHLRSNLSSVNCLGLVDNYFGTQTSSVISFLFPS